MPAITRLDLDDGVRGDDYGHEFHFVDDTTSAPINVSGWTIAAQLRRFEDDVPYVAFTFDMTNAATGIVIMRLARTVTAGLAARYAWDFQRTLASGNVWTPFGGMFTWDRDVTR